MQTCYRWDVLHDSDGALVDGRAASLHSEPADSRDNVVSKRRTNVNDQIGSKAGKAWPDGTANRYVLNMDPYFNEHTTPV